MNDQQTYARSSRRRSVIHHHRDFLTRAGALAGRIDANKNTPAVPAINLPALACWHCWRALFLFLTKLTYRLGLACRPAVVQIARTEAL